MSEEPPKLQKYFEDAPSLFDELDVTHSQLEGEKFRKFQVRIWYTD